MPKDHKVFISCAGLGMGNAARVAAVMEAMQGRAKITVCSWGAGHAFLAEFQKTAPFPFSLKALEPYPQFRGNLFTYAALYWRNTRRLRDWAREADLVLLDSDYHFFAFRRAPIFFLGQAREVVRQFRESGGGWSIRARMNFFFREYLDAWVQRIFCDFVLVPSFFPREGSGKIIPVPLIVRKDFLHPRNANPSGKIALLLSGSGLGASELTAFAEANGIPILRALPSQAEALDAYGALLVQGGLSSISECVARGIFCFVRPLRDHPEQILNARAVEALGLGKSLENELRLSGDRIQSAAPPVEGAARVADVLLSPARLSPDDWGFSPSVNTAILDLARRGLVHSVSLSVVREFVRHGLDELLGFQGVRLSLHLDLSHSSAKVPYWQLWFGGRKLKEEIDRQLNIARSLGLRLDSLNGHRHVHFYPAVLRQLRCLGLPLRRMEDRAHWPSYLAGKLASVFYSGGWESCGYLRASDLKTKSRFRRKISSFPQTICHPASSLDLPLQQLDDSLRQARVSEFEGILRLLD